MECNYCQDTNPQNFYKTNRSTCKNCLIEKQKEYYKSNTERQKQLQTNWRNTNTIRVRWLAAKHRAISKKISFNITEQDVINQLHIQKGRCKYTGREFINDTSKLYSMSIDRINSEKGYEPSNIQLICSYINTMKSDRPEKGFLQAIKEIYEYSNI